MNARQSVLIAMFLSVAVYLLANAQASAITVNIGKLKQVPAPVPGPSITVDQRPSGIGPKVA